MTRQTKTIFKYLAVGAGLIFAWRWLKGKQAQAEADQVYEGFKRLAARAPWVDTSGKIQCPPGMMMGIGGCIRGSEGGANLNTGLPYRGA